MSETNEAVVEETQTTEGGETPTTEKPTNEATTVASDGGESPDKADPPSWREQMAGESYDDYKKILERFQEPGDLLKSFKEAQDRIRSGELAKPLPENPTEEQVAEYREKHGIPEKPEGYLEKLPEGTVIGDGDKAAFESLAEKLHEQNVPPDVFNAIAEWYPQYVEQAQEQIVAADEDHRKEAEDKLREEWGPDYRKNVNIMQSLLKSQFGEEDMELLKDARLPDGRALFNVPGIVKAFSALGRQVNPISSVVEGGAESRDTLNDEIAKIEKYMREDQRAYFSDNKAQERYRELIDLRDKLDAEKAA